MLRFLAPMTQLNSKLERFLPQRTHTTACQLRDPNDRVFVFECARNSFTSALVYSRRTMPFFFAFLATYYSLIVKRPYYHRYPDLQPSSARNVEPSRFLLIPKVA